ncbi:F1-ATP synthase assembly protein [Patellaria atrata CBS 101060]|uniref:F1-ATP synthase assembly protein n=1 Tax=Patellaria atrata CBS 101060 TaxID=1346257 RepID=A0A9P4SJR6_9PEZI|nr:F1-ATP synthase assembly protein [Patellaria atrata CBS 101060]
MILEFLAPLRASSALRASPKYRTVHYATALPRYQCLHTSSTQLATPVSPNIPGPPPPPPVPTPTSAEQRVARKRKQAELLQRGKALRADPSKPSSALQKRFWKEVTVKEAEDGLHVMLDSRPVRTAAKNILTIPRNKHQLATAIALEWDQLVSAHQALKNHYIPLTSLTSRALDIQAADAKGEGKTRNDIVKILMGYLDTDTSLCWVPEKNIHDPSSDSYGNEVAESLRELQMRAAQPIISYLTTRVWPGVEITPILESDSILPTPQPEVTKQVINGWISGLPAFELAGLERAVLASKSLLVSARFLVEWSQEFTQLRKDALGSKRFGIEEAADASSLEVRWQTGMWGEVEDTHDVEKEDLKRQLGGVVLLVSG